MRRIRCSSTSLWLGRIGICRHLTGSASLTSTSILLPSMLCNSYVHTMQKHAPSKSYNQPPSKGCHIPTPQNQSADLWVGPVSSTLLRPAQRPTRLQSRPLEAKLGGVQSIIRPSEPANFMSAGVQNQSEVALPRRQSTSETSDSHLDHRSHAEGPQESRRCRRSP